jgi:hypothetical protein
MMQPLTAPSWWSSWALRRPPGVLGTGAASCKCQLLCMRSACSSPLAPLGGQAQRHGGAGVPDD